MHASRISGRFIYGGVLVIPVELNGSVFRFLVDTGAAYCAINQRLRDRIVAKPTTSTVTIASLGKKILTVPTLRIRKFVVGGMVRRNVLVSVVDFPEGFHVDGLLGMNFMSKYRITLETDTATLILREIPRKKK